jgi:hypothetical protein
MGGVPEREIFIAAEKSGEALVSETKGIHKEFYQSVWDQDPSMPIGRDGNVPKGMTEARC